jgi:hypothetical protein
MQWWMNGVSSFVAVQSRLLAMAAPTDSLIVLFDVVTNSNGGGQGGQKGFSA